MTRWKMVPNPYTDEMVEAAVPAMWTEKPNAAGKPGFLQFRAGWKAALAAAPAWEPSDEDVRAAKLAFDAAAHRGVWAGIRAALKAALGGENSDG